MSSIRELEPSEISISKCASGDSSPKNQRRMTPPEAQRIRNPFECALLHRLQKPICSPGMCKVNKKANDGTFRWEIEQHCTLMPVDIVACSSQFEPSPDPHFDKIHEEATEKFFSQEVVVPSPLLQVSKKSKKVKLTTSLSISPVGEDSVTIVRDCSSQTVLTLPPVLPPEVEAVLESFCTYTQEHGHDTYDSDTACASDYELEQDKPPPRHYEPHAPVTFSPDQLHNTIAKGMKRTFGTPLGKLKKGGYHNKILDGVDMSEPMFSPICVGTPQTPTSVDTGSSLASQSISPVTKTALSDDEKLHQASPDSDDIAMCLNCVSADTSERALTCYCRSPRTHSGLLTRSASMRESPVRHRRRSYSSRRSSSLSSLTESRSRSVQRLDFNMSVDSHSAYTKEVYASSCALAASDTSGSPKHKGDWQLGLSSHLTKSDLKIHKTDFHSEDNFLHHKIKETPIKSKSKTNVMNHFISHIRLKNPSTSMDMSLDDSMEGNDNPLNLEDKKIDFNSIDLNILASRSQSSQNQTKINEGLSLKRLDSGFNENTTFFGKSSYYESAIKPSELTVTDSTKYSNSSHALKEVSNVNWMRVDSGFKDETSSDNVQFYTEGCSSQPAKLCFSEVNLEGPNKENVFIEDFDNFLVRASARDEAMSISDIFADEMAMNCNFSSTPSKNKLRK